jgi:acetyl/propionyl-CoA carboxylase alpha subunit
MIAKIVVWAPTRESAVSKMVKVLANTVCAGVKTNQLFLQACLSHRAFQDPAYTTSLIPTHLDSLLRNPHAEAAQDMISMLSIIPGLLLRAGPASREVSKPFKHVRADFRNQYFDPVNVSSTIIVPSTEPSKPMLSVWKTSSHGQAGQQPSYHATLTPLPEVEETETSKAATSNTTAQELSRRYHAISHKLRNGSLSTAPQYTVQLKKYKPIETSDLEQTSSYEWSTLSLAVSINTSTIHAHIATDAASHPATSTGTSQTFHCHFPSLGTWIEYKCYSVLNYMESLRPSLARDSAGGGAGSKVVKAPMPCKVLSVLKKNGEEVKAGEIVLVIESMKMETNVSVSVGGTFGTGVKVGDAVDDGKVLCWVE